MKKNGFTLIELMVVIAIVTILLAIIGGGVVGCNGVTSNGERTGYITKISYKEGIIAKSWEGEMVLGGLNNTAVANTWQFTVPSDMILLDRIKYASEHGIKVTIQYHQPFFYNIWSSRSGYFVKDIFIATNVTTSKQNPFM